MKSHLIEAVHELKAKGKTEQEAIEIAINRFGGEKVIWRKWNTNNRNDYFIEFMYLFLCVIHLFSPIGVQPHGTEPLILYFNNDSLHEIKLSYQSKPFFRSNNNKYAFLPFR